MAQKDVKIYGLYLPLKFPEGIAAGSGGSFNLLTIARNGQGKPVLRGTALAGAIRHALVKDMDFPDEVFFGFASDENQSCGNSALKVPDSLLEFGKKTLPVRTHHQRNRHTGTVLDKALFTLESCPPGTTAKVVLWLEKGVDNNDDNEDFLQRIAGLFSEESGGFSLGGNVARGIGRAVLQSPAKWKVFDPSDISSCGEYLEQRRLVTQQVFLPCDAWEECHPVASNAQETLCVKFTLTIPRGQDMLVADGQGNAHQMEPQRVVFADGKRYWRLPGASLRGLFRSWITRLAARSGVKVSDSHDRYEANPKGHTGDNLAWAFMKELAKTKEGKAEARGDIHENYPVEELFGTAFMKGKLHIADAYAPCGREWSEENPFCNEEQLRQHVMLDPITGGAAGGALFDNTVLTSAGSPQFTVVMQVKTPTEPRRRASCVEFRRPSRRQQ